MATATTTTSPDDAGPTGAPDGAPVTTGRRRGRGRLRMLALSLLVGALMALAMPPAGWWPLAFVAFAVWDRLLAGATAGQRFRRSYLVGLAWYLPTVTWAWDLTPPGFVLAIAVMSLYVAVAGAVTPPGRGRRLAFPAAIVLGQALLGIMPFGGVPFSTVAMTQAGTCGPPCTALDSPLLQAARLGGPLLVTALVVIAGQALSALAAAAATRWPRLPGFLADPTAPTPPWRPAVAGLAVVVVVTGLAAVAPRGQDVAPLRVALVQGGGPQRTPPGNGDAPDVFNRHVEATRTLVQDPVDVIVWPENTVAQAGAFAGSYYEQTLQELAREKNAPIIVGVTEDTPAGENFLNASVVINPDGTTGERFDKVHAVPFGEYVPMRGLVEQLAPPGSGLPDRDALDGTGTGLLRTGVGNFAMAISYEDFFADRAAAGVRDGGEVVMNPTNGATYWLSQVQTQQIASSRLRAVETGRWHVQIAPTGFSAVIRPDGALLARTTIADYWPDAPPTSSRAVINWTVQRRTGSTPFTWWGPVPVLVLAAGALAGGWVRARRGS
jgi:apolipoprotein N-acyltransferase